MSDKLLFTGGLNIGTQIINAGCWIINRSFHIYVQERPILFHRIMVRLLLGWRWQDLGQ